MNIVPHQPHSDPGTGKFLCKKFVFLVVLNGVDYNLTKKEANTFFNDLD